MGTGKSTILDYVFKLTRVVQVFSASGKVSNRQRLIEGFDIFTSCKIKTNYHTEIESEIVKEDDEKFIKTTREAIEPLVYILNIIKTFDNINKRKIEKTVYEQDDRKNYILTDLDEDLDERITDYVDYQLNLNKKLRNKGTEYDTVFAKQRYFIDTVNRLFLKTEKKINEEENRLSFILNDGKKILPYQLSSGEKQLLIILLRVLNKDEKPSILLLDEPEISLHFTWQYELINIIRELNPNCQVIIATHSVSIFAKGWMDKLFYMNGKEGEENVIRHKIPQMV